MHKDNKRVLLLGPKPPAAGGIAKFIENCIDSMNNAQYHVYDTGRHVHIINDRNRYASKAAGEMNGLKNLTLKIIITLKHIILFPFVLSRVHPQIVQIQYSMNWSFWENSFYLIISRLFRKKIIIRLGSSNMEQYFDSSNELLFRLKKFILNMSDRVIVQSNYWYSYFSYIVDKDKLIIIGNAVRAPSERPKKNYEDTWHVLFEAGGNARRKGAFDVLRVVSQLKDDRFNGYRFHCMDTTTEIENKINDLSLSDHIITYPYVRGLYKERLLNKCHFFLLPSYSEGFPNSVLEAMAHGLLVISTPVGSLPEIIIDDNYGYLVEPGDIQTIVSILKELYSNTDELIRIGKNNYERVTIKYDIRSLGEMLDNLYSSV